MKQMSIFLCVVCILLTGCAENISLLTGIVTKKLVLFQCVEEITAEGKLKISEDAEDPVIVPLKEVLAYESNFSQYNAYNYRNTLTEDEKIVYDTIIYMLEQDYQMFGLGFQLDISDERLKSIYNMVIADDPSIANGEPWGNFVQTEGESFIGMYTLMENPNTNAQNLEALEAAQELLAWLEIEEEHYDCDKALKIYEYLMENVSYPYTVDEGGNKVYRYDVDTENVSYLYSALVEKQTNCEGFSNAFSLLCNMAGVDCYEVLYSNVNLMEYYESLGIEGENFESGHIWNVITLKSYTQGSDGTEQVFSTDHFVDVSMASHLLHLTGKSSLFYFGFDRDIMMPVELFQEPVREVSSLPLISSAILKEEEDLLENQEFIVEALATNGELQMMIANELDQEAYCKALEQCLVDDYALELQKIETHAYSNPEYTFVLLYTVAQT